MDDIFKGKDIFGQRTVSFVEGKNGDVFLAQDGNDENRGIVPVKKESLVEYAVQEMEQTNTLLCPKCQNEKGTTSFIKYDEKNGTVELRKCDSEDCKCEYKIQYVPHTIEIVD